MSRLERAEGHRTERDPAQRDHAVPERLAEALDLVLAALGERESKPAFPRTGTLEIDGERPRGPVVERDAAAPALEIAPGHAALDHGLVDPR